MSRIVVQTMHGRDRRHTPPIPRLCTNVGIGAGVCRIEGRNTLAEYRRDENAAVGRHAPLGFFNSNIFEYMLDAPSSVEIQSSTLSFILSNGMTTSCTTCWSQ